MYKNLLPLLLALNIVFYSCSHTNNKANQVNTNPKSEYTLNIKVKGAPNKTFYLSRYFGNKTLVVDTLVTDNTGSIKKVLNTKVETGLYKLLLGNRNSFNFIINHEDIELQTFVVNAPDSMQVVSSDENKILYLYYKQQGLFNKKMSLLLPLIQNYPKKDKFFAICIKEINRIQQDHAKYLTELTGKSPGSFVSKYIAFNGFQAVNPELTEKEQKQIWIENYLSYLQFCDTMLLSSDAYPQKIISYLSLFNDQALAQDRLELLYKKALDNLLDKALCNDRVFEFTLNYLIEGFEQLKYEEVLAHLSEKYIPMISCVNENLKNNLEDKTRRYEKVSIGKKAPAFKLRTLKNELISLDNINSEKILMIFWASWCPHCKNILPAIDNINRLYPKERLEIIAISLDTKKEEWVSFLNNYDFTWINASELKGWDSKVAIDYNIYATPTMFLLDKNKRIIAKPRTVEELNKLLQ